MKNLLQNNKQIVSIFIIIGIGFLIIIIFLKNTINYPILEKQNQLAQISIIETTLLKQWQKSKSLKNSLVYNNTGSDVILLQNMLAQDKNIYPEKIMTGRYDDLTKKAVVRFQNKYNLSLTGFIDEQTKNKLNEIFLRFLCPEPQTIYPDFFFQKINKNNPLPMDYIPSNLINISDQIKTTGIICARQETLESLIKMFQDAEKDGVYLAITSGYRMPEIQNYLYNFYLGTEKLSTIAEIAKPGVSEHQLGTTFDFTDESINYAGYDNRFAHSKGGQWIIKNAYKYGFIMSYPKDKEKITGYKYEPWHWRFVGKDVAASIYNQKLTFNESFSKQKVKPYPRDNNRKGLNISAAAAFSLFIDNNGNEYILLEKNKDRKLPIASITKLMVALIASDIYKQDDLITITRDSFNLKGLSGQYRIGDQFYLKEALTALLVASHNEIADALAAKIGRETFLQKMNEKAKALNLNNTQFFNVTGLDPDKGSSNINYSSPSDIAKLLKYIFENKKDIFSIMGQSEYRLIDANGLYKMTIKNTNKLLTEENIPLKVLGGKTGETPLAKSNLAIISEAPTSGQIINIVINSQNNFEDMKKMLQYIKEAFVW